MCALNIHQHKRNRNKRMEKVSLFARCVSERARKRGEKERTDEMRQDEIREDMH